MTVCDYGMSKGVTSVRFPFHNAVLYNNSNVYKKVCEGWVLPYKVGFHFNLSSGLLFGLSFGNCNFGLALSVA